MVAESKQAGGYEDGKDGKNNPPISSSAPQEISSFIPNANPTFNISDSYMSD